MIGELVQVRDGQLHLHISQCELCTVIEYVCMMCNRQCSLSFVLNLQHTFAPSYTIVMILSSTISCE